MLSMSDFYLQVLILYKFNIPHELLYYFCGSVTLLFDRIWI